MTRYPYDNRPQRSGAILWLFAAWLFCVLPAGVALVVFWAMFK